MTTERDSKGESLLRGATVCDLTLPFEAGTEGREEVLERFHRTGIGFVSLTVSTDAHGTAATIHNMANVRRMIRERGDCMTFVRSVAEIRTAKAQGKLALGFHFQG